MSRRKQFPHVTINRCLFWFLVEMANGWKVYGNLTATAWRHHHLYLLCHASLTACCGENKTLLLCSRHTWMTSLRSATYTVSVSNTSCRTRASGLIVGCSAMPLSAEPGTGLHDHLLSFNQRNLIKLCSRKIVSIFLE